ncbi:hypothetical protein [Algoriphagus sp.]|uniref:hypothetical protein n=1 Tax=Algoriphagus sp. TaxID=1872435 RepID=UPI0039191642
MKIKFYQSLASLALLSVMLWSCSDLIDHDLETTEFESPDLTYEQAISLWQDLDREAGHSFGYRMKSDYNYFEDFQNNLFFVPGENYEEGPAPGFYPGTGTGTATRMGKAKSFVNQFAFFDETGLKTIGAPVTMFFGDELDALGIKNIPNEVSSITVGKKKDSIWIKNISNTVTPISNNLSSFIAEVEFVGGTGKFAKFKGTGVVRGNFNPMNGEGTSVTLGNLKHEK